MDSIYTTIVTTDSEKDKVVLDEKVLRNTSIQLPSERIEYIEADTVDM